MKKKNENRGPRRFSRRATFFLVKGACNNFPTNYAPKTFKINFQLSKKRFSPKGMLLLGM
jgi:hypothetical protein